MSEIPTDPPSRTCSTAWRVILALVVLIFLVVGFSAVVIVCFVDQRQKRTEVVIQTIKTGLALEMANRGTMPELTFDSLREAFGRSSALVELSSLKAIDDQQKWFVDAWGHRLSITYGEHYSIVVVSPGRDGVPGTRDDIR